MTIKEILEIRNAKDLDSWVKWIKSLSENEAMAVFRKLDEYEKSKPEYKTDKRFRKRIDKVGKELDKYEKEQKQYDSAEELMAVLIAEQGDEYKVMRADILARLTKDPTNKRLLEMVEGFKATEKHSTNMMLHFGITHLSSIL